MNKIFFLAVFACSIAVTAQKLPANLTVALKNQDPQAIASLVNANNKETCYEFNNGNLNILQLAVSMGSTVVVNQLLVDLKVNPNAACNSKPALHFAASNGNSALVQELLKAGADSKVAFEGKTAREFALDSKNEATIALLNK